MITRRDGCIVSSTIEGQTFHFFVANQEDEIQKYHFDGQFYEAKELEIIRRYYRRGTLFVDIGTNIGNHAIFAEKILGAAEVIVFEPNPVAIAHLEINLRLNDCRRINRSYLGLLISDEIGQTMKITLSPGNNLGNTMFGACADGEFRTITGDFALAHRPVGFIKIDTEEMEFQVLKGLSATFAVWRPNIFVEIVEKRESELEAWAKDNSYRIAESQKRYHLLRNYVLTPA